MDVLFKDRHDAGRALAKKLKGYANRPDIVVMGLPRGGMVVAYEVALALSAPLHAFVVRKLGVPGQEELALGALASGDIVVFNEDILDKLNITQREVQHVIEKEKIELKRRQELYGENQFPLSLQDDHVILIDDGLATGATMQAAISAIRKLNPVRLIMAVPVSAQETCRKLTPLVDEVICAHTPTPFYSVGQWYENFDQTTDKEVCELLQSARRNISQKDLESVGGKYYG